jgi:hypothetical protein
MAKKRDIPFPRPKAAPVKKGEPHPQHTEAEVKAQRPKQPAVVHAVRSPTANRRGS